MRLLADVPQLLDWWGNRWAQNSQLLESENADELLTLYICVRKGVVSWLVSQEIWAVASGKVSIDYNGLVHMPMTREIRTPYSV